MKVRSYGKEGSASTDGYKGSHSWALCLPSPRPPQEGEDMKTEKEGWAYVHYLYGVTRKAHYIKDNRSLCGRYIWLGDVEEGKDDSPDNCASCKRKLKKLKEKKVKK